MRTFLPVTILALFMSGMAVLQADYLKNTDFKGGLAAWHGEGDAAFLKPDGTEGADGDKDVIPVIKIALSKGAVHAVYQDYETRDNPKTQHVHIEVYASSDFKRSKFPSDFSPNVNWQSGAVWYWSAAVVPNDDFWIRVAPGFLYKVSDLKPGQWTTIDGNWDTPPQAQDRSVAFIVPKGTGTIYIKNPSATP